MLCMGKQQLSGHCGITALNHPVFSVFHSNAHFLVIQVKGVYWTPYTSYSVLGLEMMLGPEGPPPSLWKEGSRVDREPRACSSGSPCEPPQCSRLCPVAPAGWHDCNRRALLPRQRSRCTVLDFLGDSWASRRTSVMWKSQPAGYFGHLALVWSSARRSVCLVGQSHVPAEALRAQQAERERTLGIYYSRKFQLGTYVAFWSLFHGA